MRAIIWPKTYLTGTALAWALSSCTLGLGGGDDETDTAAPARTEATLSGNAEVLIARYDDHSDRQYYVRTDDGEHVRVEFDADPGQIQPEEQLSLAGYWNIEKTASAPTFTATAVLKHLGVDHAAAGGTEGGAILSDAQAAAGRSPLEHKVAVILLGSPKYTKQQAWNQVNPTAGSAAAYISEVSGGIDTLKGDVFGPYSVNTSNCADRAYEIADLAKSAAAKDGKNLSAYGHIAFLLPGGQNCGWGGLGQVGSPGSTRQVLTWYSNWFECGVVAHELGHNLGMNHSHSTACSGAMYAANRQGCRDNEYGHPFDVMGDASCGRDGHYGAPQKEFMGWFKGCEDVTAGASAQFNLSPIEGKCGVRSLRIPIPGESNFYYLEYRKVSAGAFAGARGQDRVLLTVSNDGARVRPDPYFLDATPTTSDRRDGWLAVGTNYSLPGGVQIKVSELGEVARVQVVTRSSGTPKCHSGETPPADEAGRFGTGCNDGCPSDPNKTSPGYCGCGVPDVDSDRDGTRDCTDGCPSDPQKTAPGKCGCGATELSCSGSSAGLIRDHYTGSWSTLPNFTQLKADKTQVVSSIDVSDYAGDDDFGVVFSGGIRIDRAGTYDFELSSDDGSRLRIDDREVITNDGIHGLLARTGSVSLSAGTHAIRVEFFEQGGGESLRLRYRLSGGTFTTLPSSVLVHAGSPTTDQCPDDPNKTEPGQCGCGTSDADSDQDGVANCKDLCPSDAKKTAPGACGCGVAEGSCPAACTDTLNANGQLNIGQSLCSKSKAYTLGMRSDGALVLRAGSQVLWDSGTRNTTAYALMQNDGNFVIYDSAHVGLWSSKTAGKNGATLVLQDDGLVTIRYQGGVVWSVGTRDECPSDPNKTVAGICGCGQAEGTCSSRCTQTKEGAIAQLSCPSGQGVTAISFASYGTPTGACGSFTASTCSASGSAEKVKQACFGKPSCAISASNEVFGDPCVGTPKSLAIQYLCGAPLSP